MLLKLFGKEKRSKADSEEITGKVWRLVYKICLYWKPLRGSQIDELRESLVQSLIQIIGGNSQLTQMIRSLIGVPDGPSRRTWKNSK